MGFEQNVENFLFQTSGGNGRKLLETVSLCLGDAWICMLDAWKKVTNIFPNGDLIVIKIHTKNHLKTKQIQRCYGIYIFNTPTWSQLVPKTKKNMLSRFMGGEDLVNFQRLGVNS